MFRWNPFRLTQLTKRVRAYNRAITIRSNELVSLGVRELAEYLPEKVTTGQIQSMIRNVNDFRRIVGYNTSRSSMLTRILKRYNEDALDFIMDETGTPVTVYEQREYELDKKALKRRTSERRQGYDFDGMDELDYADLVDKTELLEDTEGEIDLDIEDIEPEIKSRWEREDARAKRDTGGLDSELSIYLAIWRNPMNAHDSMAGYQDLIDALTWLRDKHPDYLQMLFDSGADELDPFFIIDSPDGKHPNPYRHIPYDARHNRAVAYVTSKAYGKGWKDGAENVG